MPEWTLVIPEAAELVVVPWLGAIFATSNGNIIDDFTTTKVIHSKYYEDSKETKDQIKPKAAWPSVDSPKKRTNIFFGHEHKEKKSFICFLGESMARQTAFGFILPIAASLTLSC